MTNQAKPDKAFSPELPFLADHKALLAMRVRPAEFARMMGVSRQTVSTWIKQGKISINVIDGRLDVQRAIQDVLRNTPPGRMRSRVLRQAVTDTLALRVNLATAEDRAEAAEAELRKARASLAHLEAWIEAGEKAAAIFMNLVVDSADELRTLPTEAWKERLSDLSNAADVRADEIVYGVDLTPDDEHGAASPDIQREAPTQEGGGGA